MNPCLSAMRAGERGEGKCRDPSGSTEMNRSLRSKVSDTPITMEKLISLGSLPPECAQFLAMLVKARYSMVIGGGTGSGKTTFLGALSNYIPKDEGLSRSRIMQN